MNNNSHNHNNNNNNIKTSFMSFDTNFHKTYLELLISLLVHIDYTFLCLEFHPLSLWIDVFFWKCCHPFFCWIWALRTHEKLSLFWQLWFPHWGWRYHWLGNTLYQRRDSGWFSGPFFSNCFISLFQNIFGPRKKINIQFLQYKFFM